MAAQGGSPALHKWPLLCPVPRRPRVTPIDDGSFRSLTPETFLARLPPPETSRVHLALIRGAQHQVFLGCRENAEIGQADQGPWLFAILPVVTVRSDPCPPRGKMGTSTRLWGWPCTRPQPAATLTASSCSVSFLSPLRSVSILQLLCCSPSPLPACSPCSSRGWCVRAPRGFLAGSQGTSPSLGLVFGVPEPCSPTAPGSVDLRLSGKGRNQARIPLPLTQMRTPLPAPLGPHARMPSAGPRGEWASSQHLLPGSWSPASATPLPIFQIPAELCLLILSDFLCPYVLTTFEGRPEINTCVSSTTFNQIPGFLP